MIKFVMKSLITSMIIAHSFTVVHVFATESRRASVATVTPTRPTVVMATTPSARGLLSRSNTLPVRPASAPKTTAKDSTKSNRSEASFLSDA